MCVCVCVCVGGGGGLLTPFFHLQITKRRRCRGKIIIMLSTSFSLNFLLFASYVHNNYFMFYRHA